MAENNSTIINNTGVVIDGTNGGKHVVGGPLTTDIVRSASNFLLDEIDQRITKIRPMATPIDQISRLAGAKPSGSMVVDYYSVDTKPTTATLTNEHTEPAEGSAKPASTQATLQVDKPEMFSISETILVKGVKGYDETGTKVTENADLMLYVISKTSSTITAMAVNGKKIDKIEGCVPNIPAGTTFIRMGRAATELDVQTEQFESLPVKNNNYCQIFKCQIEQSSLEKIANKEINWNFSDQEEAAIYDMRLGMEKNFLFGIKRTVYDPNKHEDVRFTGGIWAQAGKDFQYTPSTFTQNTLIQMMKEAFTGNAGSKHKLLIGGSELIERINTLETTKVVNAGENVVKWGIDFSEIRSKFGTLYVLMSEVFDECGMASNGMIIDPDYIQKYSHIPFSSEALNLKQAGVRNTDAIVLTEASCLTLRYPNAHMRITVAENSKGVFSSMLPKSK